MTSSYYSNLCKANNIKKIEPLELQLLADPTIIDVSGVYLPRKHLKCIFELVKNCQDIKKVILDEVAMEDEDIFGLCDSLRQSHVNVVSLKNVKLSMGSGEQILSLCQSNKEIYAVVLQNSLLTDRLIDSIGLACELNNIDARSSVGFTGIKKEQPKIKPFLFNGLCNRKLSELKVIGDCCPVTIMSSIVDSQCDFFNDDEFMLEEQLFGFDITWIQATGVVKRSARARISCTGAGQVVESRFFSNTKLHTALCLLQQLGLQKGTMGKKIPEIGFYSFNFFVDGGKTSVVVDDKIPFASSSSGVVPFGIYSETLDVWGALIEKAIAKLLGGYKKIDDLSHWEIISLLTGGSPFSIHWSDLFHLKTEAMFSFLRDLLNGKGFLFSVAVPAHDATAKLLEEKNIVSQAPYTVIASDVYVEKDIKTFLVQLVLPYGSSIPQDAFTRGAFAACFYNDFQTCWVPFENYVTLFEYCCLLKWPFEDPERLYIKRQVRPSVSLFPPTSSRFALNTAFALENTGFNDDDIVLSVFQCGEIKTDCLQLFFFKLYSDEKRYDVSRKNQLISSCVIRGDGGSVLYHLRAKEKVQLVTSSSGETNCQVETASLETCRLTPLSDSAFFYTCRGAFTEDRGSFFIWHSFFRIQNVSNSPVKELTVSLSQKGSALFPVSVLGWNGKFADVSGSPDINTQKESDAVSVYNLGVTIKPGDYFVLLPCSHSIVGKQCRFSLTIYSSVQLDICEQSCCP